MRTYLDRNIAVISFEHYVQKFIERYSNCVLKGEMSDISAEARLAQSVEHETLNLRVVGSSPTLGDNFFDFFSYIEH